GDIEDLDSLRAGVANADAVIHLGFIHDFAKYVECCQVDGRAIRTMGECLVGSNRLFIVTSAVAAEASNDDDTPDELVAVKPGQHPRGETQQAAAKVAATGVRVVVVRLPPSVHNQGDRGFVPTLISIARKKGESAFVGDGQNRWPAVHRLDAAVLYRLVVENSSESCCVHAIAEEGVPLREIAQRIGNRLGVAVVSKSKTEIREHFGWMAAFVGNDRPRISAWTKEKFNWKSVHCNLLAGIDSDAYIPL
ncbi:hypothetical protein AeNC1_012119, partial [Aphanomyces euteiches]